MSDLSIDTGNHPQSLRYDIYTPLTTTVFSFGRTLKNLKVWSPVDMILFFETCQRAEMNGGNPAFPYLTHLEIQGMIGDNAGMRNEDYAEFFDNVAKSLSQMPNIERLHIMSTNCLPSDYLIHFEIQQSDPSTGLSYASLKVARYLLSDEIVQPFTDHVKARLGIDLDTYRVDIAFNGTYTDAVMAFTNESFQVQMDFDMGVYPDGYVRITEEINFGSIDGDNGSDAAFYSD
jgi:hypothetical protein